jgi:hypothetical protein
MANRLFFAIQEELGKLDASERQLRKFGLLVGGILAFLCGWLFWRYDSNLALLGSIVGIVLVVFGFMHAAALAVPYRYWMGIAVVLGFFVGPVILSIIFYAIITPISFLKRLLGSPNKREEGSFWKSEERVVAPKGMEQLF